MIKGIFNKEQIQEFLYPLQFLNTIIDAKSSKSGIIFNFDSINKEINVYVSNMSVGTLVFLKYKNLLNSFHVDDEKIGIINISDFIKYFSIIEDDNTEIEFNNNKFYIKDGTSEISFQTADIAMIAEGLKTFKGQDWIISTEFDEKFDKLQKAMKSMVNEEYLFIKTDSQNKKTNFIVRKKDLDTNNYKTTIDTDVKSDIEIAINKEYFQNASSIKCDSMNFQISDRLINFNCKRKNSEISVFIAKATKLT
jgi:hypothetical protein